MPAIRAHRQRVTPRTRRRGTRGCEKESRRLGRVEKLQNDRSGKRLRIQRESVGSVHDRESRRATSRFRQPDRSSANSRAPGFLGIRYNFPGCISTTSIRPMTESAIAATEGDGGRGGGLLANSRCAHREINRGVSEQGDRQDVDGCSQQPLAVRGGEGRRKGALI